MPGKMAEPRANTPPGWEGILKEGKIGYISNLIEKQHNNQLFTHNNRLTFIMDLDIAKGIIYGLAIGDALGRPTEFLPLLQIKSEYGQDGITDLPDPALYNDDTQMSIAIAEALIKAGEKDIESIMLAEKKETL